MLEYHQSCLSSLTSLFSPLPLSIPPCLHVPSPPLYPPSAPPPSSQERTQALHTELDSVQALRGQLEEVLARTRSTALALERASGGPEGAGGGDGCGGPPGLQGHSH